MENVVQAQPMMGMQQAPAATGLSAWMDKETFWFMVKVIFFTAIVIFGIKYFYDRSNDKKALEKVEKTAPEEESPEAED